jgi:uncharacterized surface protein with fasciclin (FAS1) repeats
MAMGTIVDIAAGDPQFSTLVELVTAAGLAETLADPNGTFTVFAPTNDAFAAVPAEVLEMLAADTDLLASVLTYHVLGEVVTSSDIGDMGGMGSPATVNGATVEVTTQDGNVFVN